MDSMQAWLLERLAPVTAGASPLRLARVPRPQPAAGEIRLRVQACGICHTELDEIEGRMPPPRLPVIPGYQAVGVVDALGAGCTRFAPGDRVGVAWIFSACGDCAYCRSGRENLCPAFQASGRDHDGGYAEWMVVPATHRRRHWTPSSTPRRHGHRWWPHSRNSPPAGGW